MVERMVIVAFSGSPDKMFAMATLCSGAIAQDYEVDIYLMQWGVHAFRKDVAETDRPYAEHDELRSTIQENAAKIGLQPWHEMLADLKELGELRIHVCSTAPKLVGVEKEDLLDIVDDIVGAVEIVSAAKDADVHFFI
jgi:peroxiredoxin family protein